MVQQSFSRIIEAKLKEGTYMRFDRFLIRRMGYELKGSPEQQEAARKQAYLTFLHRISKENPASLPTIRRWFGIYDFTAPSREQIFRIAFALELGLQETEEYLVQGLRAPSFQINDYSEMIAMYCLEHRRGYAEYQSMVLEYEGSLQRQQEILRESNTQWLFRQFEFVKQYDEEQFMRWMWENAGIFKGYSMTVQEYLDKYREHVVEYMRTDTKKRLELLLSETGYAAWRKKRIHATGEKEGQLIRKYIKWDARNKKSEIPEHLGKSILELAKLAYSENGLNARLLSELFTLPKSSPSKQAELPAHTIRAVSGKYLSDLFHIPERNEMRIRVRQAIQELKRLERDAACPDYILNIIEKYGRRGLCVADVGEALEWLEEFDGESRRRRLVVKRDDLLPMILYVAQQRYLKKGGAYCCSAAKRMFTDLANATLIACNMAPLDENYVYDMILLACFQEEEMYGYEDVLELVR